MELRYSVPSFNKVIEIGATGTQVATLTAMEGWATGSVTRIRPDGAKSDSVSLTAPPADTAMLKVDLLEGRWLQPDDTNALVVNSDFLDDEPTYRIGDIVVLDIAARETDWQIIGVVGGDDWGDGLR